MNITTEIGAARKRQKEIIAELHQLPENQLVQELEERLERARRALTQKQKPLLGETMRLSRKIGRLQHKE